MIGSISGTIVWRAPDHVVVDAGGIGYAIHCNQATLAMLPTAGERCTLFTELHVREDLMQLFGFAGFLEREWFRRLQKVQGIGARGALTIVGELGVEGISQALAIGDEGALRAVKGIGPKTAKRVVTELKDEVPVVMSLASGAGIQQGSVADAAAKAPTERTVVPVQLGTMADKAAGTPWLQARADAQSALENLGFGSSEVARAIAMAAEPLASDNGSPPADAVNLTDILIRGSLAALDTGNTHE